MDNLSEEEQERLNDYIHYSLENTRHFPWEWYGGVPRIGSIHGYLLKLLNPYLIEQNKQYVLGNPSLSELERRIDYLEQAELDDPVFRAIVNYSAEKSQVAGFSVAHHVLYFLARFPQFREDFKKKMWKHINS